MLSSILVELQRRDGTFRQDLEDASIQASAIVSFEDYLNNGKPRTESDLLELFCGTWDGYIWEGQSPAYQGWRDSGRVDIISSEELRTAIYDYHNVHLRYIGNLTVANRELRQSYVDASIRDIYQITPRDTGVPGLQNNFRAVAPFEEIPRNSDLYAIMNRYGASSSFIANRLKNSLTRTNSLIEKIELHLQNL